MQIVEKVVFVMNSNWLSVKSVM